MRMKSSEYANRISNDHRRENHSLTNLATATGTCRGEVLPAASEHEPSQHRTIQQIPMKSIAESLVITALTKLGVKESGGNNKGKELQPFFSADNYKTNANDDG